jgi:hypothetical protein
MTILSNLVFPSFLPEAPVHQPRIPVKRRGRTIDSINILLQQHPVPFPLHLCHSDVEIDLLLW